MRDNEEEIKIICNDRGTFTHVNVTVFRGKKKLRFYRRCFDQIRIFNFRSINLASRDIIHRRIGEYRYRSILRNIPIQYLET